MLIGEPEPALLCQPRIGMAMHGGMKSGWMVCTSTRSGLTPACELNNLLKQNTQLKADLACQVPKSTQAAIGKSSEYLPNSHLSLNPNRPLVALRTILIRK